MTFSVLLLSSVLLGASPQQSNASPPADAAATQPTAQAPSTPVRVDPDELPISLKRIQRALSRPPVVRIREPEMRQGRPLYRVDVEAEKLDIVDLLGKDFLRGQASYGGMSHQEFLDLVTPKDVQGYAAFSNKQGLVVAATSIALQWAVLKAIDEFKKAKDAREREAARKEVQEALEALRRARKAAGLPDK
jgi:hypothetical protein